jgi:hypothetical protein
MAITFVAKDDQSATAATSITVNVPAGAAVGDLLLAFIHTTGTKVTASSNDFAQNGGKWVLLGRQVSGGSTITNWAYYRIMQSGDTSWTFSTTASVQTQGTVVAYNESGTPKWLIGNSGDQAQVADSSALTNSTAQDAFVNDGIIIQVTFAYRSGGTILTLTHDVGTSRVSFVNGNSNLGMAVYDQIGTGDLASAFTSTLTTTSSLAPSDHYAMAYTVQSTPTGEFYDPADLIDASAAWTGHVYKGRDLAANDTTGVV